MKYSEFKAEVEKMGYWVDIDHAPIYVDKSKDGETLMSIGKHKQFWLDPRWSGFNNLTKDQKLKLYELGYELAKTPLAEREEEKWYRLQYNVPPLLARKYANPQYLYIRRMDGHEDISFDLDAGPWFQTIFTESEIAEMDITGFEKIEVPE